MNSLEINPATCDITSDIPSDIGLKVSDIAPQRRTINFSKPKMSLITPRMSLDVTDAKVTIYRPSAATDDGLLPHVTVSLTLQTKGSRVRRLHTHECVRVLA